MRLLYHRTPRENVASILNMGLVPKYNFVCLSENKNSWWNDLPLFVVDIDAFIRDYQEVRITTWQPESDEICVWGIIPPKYIRLVNDEKQAIDMHG